MLILTLLVSISLQATHRLIIVLEYALNKDFIVTMLCINKDKPQLKCEGKCQLKKQFDQQEKKEHHPLATSLDKRDTLVFHEIININHMKNEKSNSQNSIYLVICLDPSKSSVFQPPKV